MAALPEVFHLAQRSDGGGELILQWAARPNRNWGSSDLNVPVSRITAKQIVPVPVIQARGKTFKILCKSRWSESGRSYDFSTRPTDPSHERVCQVQSTFSSLIDQEW